MSRRITWSAIAALMMVSSSACENVPSDRVLTVSETGTVVGTAYVDRNGNGVFDLSDTRLNALAVRLFQRGALTPVATTTTDANGNFSFSNVAVGEYEVRIDNSAVPDSLRLIKVDSSTVRLFAGDSVGVLVNLSFPSTNIRDVRTLPLGRRVFVEAVSHNAFTTFGDSTIHVADSTGTIRATRIAPVTITPGLKLRLLGTVGVQDGQRVITDVTLFVLGTGIPPAPVGVTTQKAANADGGRLDAVLVQVTNAVIVGSQTNSAQDVVLSVSDGSGLLDIVLDRQAGITTTSLVPGANVAVTGLLVPTQTAGVWVLKPRNNADISASFSTVTVAEARALPAGRVVTIQGVALNSWFSFADSTVHLNDATGSIRAVRVTPINLFAGDNIRLLGTIALRDGQPILTNVTATVLGTGVVPLPQVLTTAAAATANGGLQDAALVKIINATISTVVNSAGDVILTVNDGTGPVDVVLDKDVGFALAPFVVGAKIDATGVLVTTPGGAVWRLKPRAPADVVVR